MGTNSDLSHKGSVIRYDTDILEPMEPRLFDVDWVQKNHHHRGSSPGRNQAHFVTYGGHDMVLRHFRRGGLVGKLNRDLYLGVRNAKTRAMREFELLGWMHNHGLPVPRPIAALVAHRGVFYRAAILTERIPGARPFQEILAEGMVPSGTWNTVGAVIRCMHDHHVFHSDLNCRNILIDTAHQAWLIDFDKCARRKPGPWKAQNLDRLKRSLHKQNRAGANVTWTDEDWSELMRGYADADKEFDGTQAHP
ncbi:MAG: 3-deoxy-D-manno-octulosonic acid kinase [Sedimentitalea sp.]